MNKKLAIRDVKAGMEFKVTTPTELNFFGVYRSNVNNKDKTRKLEEEDILTVLKVIDNNQVLFMKENGDRHIAFWQVFKDETVPNFDTKTVLNKNTVAYYLEDNNLDKLKFGVVKKEYMAHTSNIVGYVIEYPITMGVRYEYGMKSNFNLDVIKAYKTDENMEELQQIILTKLKENWEEIQPLVENNANKSKIKIFTRRKKVIVEIAKLSNELEEAKEQVKNAITQYKNDSKTHIIVK